MNPGHQMLLNEENYIHQIQMREEETIGKAGENGMQNETELNQVQAQSNDAIMYETSKELSQLSNGGVSTATEVVEAEDDNAKNNEQYNFVVSQEPPFEPVDSNDHWSINLNSQSVSNKLDENEYTDFAIADIGDDHDLHWLTAIEEFVGDNQHSLSKEITSLLSPLERHHQIHRNAVHDQGEKYQQLGSAHACTQSHIQPPLQSSLSSSSSSHSNTLKRPFHQISQHIDHYQENQVHPSSSENLENFNEHEHYHENQRLQQVRDEDNIHLDSLICCDSYLSSSSSPAPAPSAQIQSYVLKLQERVKRAKMAFNLYQKKKSHCQLLQTQLRQLQTQLESSQKDNDALRAQLGNEKIRFRKLWIQKDDLAQQVKALQSTTHTNPNTATTIGSEADQASPHDARTQNLLTLSDSCGKKSVLPLGSPVSDM